MMKMPSLNGLVVIGMHNIDDEDVSQMNKTDISSYDS
jgi:hypothetical protein